MDRQMKVSIHSTRRPRGRTRGRSMAPVSSWVARTTMKVTVMMSLSLLLLLPHSVVARTTSGKFQLSGLNSEHVLGSFAVSPRKRGTMQLYLTTGEKPYHQRDQDLKVHMFTDESWSKIKKNMACVDKVPHAAQSEHINLIKRSNNRYTAELVMSMDNMRTKDRSRYFYFIVDDCSLEQYMHDSAIPPMKFSLHTWNDGSNLSADEQHLHSLHTWSLLCSCILAALLIYQVTRRMSSAGSNGSGGALHVSVLIVLLAVLADVSSSLCELWHLKLYTRDGIGSYSMDAMSAVFESICDSLIAFLLLAIGAGWTLPSDVLGHSYGSGDGEGGGAVMQRVLSDLQKPIRSKGPMPIAGASILFIHLGLMQWGRTYDFEFDSYHDFEHRPGQILMLMRIVLGFVFSAAVARTRQRCPTSLRGFYVQLWAVGCVVYFWSLPILVLVVTRMIPYRNRHKFIGFGSGMLQAASLLLLSWLVAATANSSSFHKLSRATTGNTEDSLTDRMAASSNSETISSASSSSTSWKFGKSKVRLD